MLILRNHRKIGIFLHGFELVGIGEEAACVSEDVSEPSALFFDGEEVVNFWLIGWLVHSLHRLRMIQLFARTLSGEGSTCRSRILWGRSACMSGKCQVLLYCSFSRYIEAWDGGVFFVDFFSAFLYGRFDVVDFKCVEKARVFLEAVPNWEYQYVVICSDAHAHYQSPAFRVVGASPPLDAFDFGASYVANVPPRAA